MALTSAHAAEVTPQDEYMKRLKVYQTVQPLGDTPFGESINLYTGELSFSQTDIAIEGTGPSIVLARETMTAQTRDEKRLPEAFHDWTLSVPRIETLMPLAATREPAGASPTIAAPGGAWKVPSATDPYARCSQFGPPGTAGVFQQDDWWHGYELITESGNRQQLLRRTAENTLKPTITGVFPVVTSQNWQITCLPNTSNNQLGEGFLAISPDGTKYSFDYLVGERVNGMVKEMEPGGRFYLQRALGTMYVSRIEDRFGNAVSYHYTGDKLTSITATDGRAVSILWRTDARAIDQIIVQPAAPAPRVWRYEYASATVYGVTRTWLSAVVQPDNARWAFNLNGIGENAGSEWFSQCGSRDSSAWSGGSYVSTLTHPSGLVGTFTTAGKAHVRSYVPGACIQDSWDTPFYEAIPPLYGTNSLIEKRLSGPGLSPQTWAYGYSGAQGSTTADACAATGTCPETASVTVTDADGNATRYTHSTRWGATEGKLLSTEVFQGASTLLRSETLSYASANAGPYPSRLGDSMQGWRSNIAKSETWTPTKQRQITQQGTAFTWAVDATCAGVLCFDAFARPTRVTRSSTLGFTKTETIEYHDNTALWVLGQVKRTTTNGIETATTTYDPVTALPTQTTSFGKLQQTLSYDTTSTVLSGQRGTLKTVADGNGNVTTLTIWKRGIPQLIQFPATPDQPSGASMSAVVNDQGWIDSVTDENRYKTCYEYDAMGRMRLITYPSETQLDVCDASKWNPTLRVFAASNAAKYGLPLGHWQQIVSTGNGVQTTYYDALWRPVVSERYDSANPTGTRSVSVTRYDADGQPVYQSYPMASLTDFAAVTQGTRTFYDALDRVTRIEQDSELGVLATTKVYDGIRIYTTNPRQQQTIVGHRMYDQPTYDLPHGIIHPEGANTEIYLNTLDKPYALRRRNVDGSLSVWRYYDYDQHQQLCRVTEPETGATVMGYDNAGNLAWSASGLPAGTPCDGTNSAVVARKASRTYDARNRVKSLSFPDGKGNQTWTYTPDGLPDSITTNNSNGGEQVLNTYSYYKRRLLIAESVTQPGWYSWGIGHDYNANGHLQSQNYPTGLSIDYAPNALGQSTKAGSYATGVSYYPNGAIHQFTYGNGIVHTMGQNARQLPARSTDSGGALDDAYNYDANGNVDSIIDKLLGEGVYSPRSRWMSYDGLDRLTGVGAGMFGGTDNWHRFTYDTLDNIKSWKLAGVKDYANYYYEPGTNRLTIIQNSVGASIVGLGYDPQGNLSNKNGQGYVFDYGNRLRSATNLESYRYDGHGRRVETIKADGKLHLWHYSQAGQMMFGWTGPTSQKTQEYVYLGGSLVASIEHDWPSNAITSLKYQHTDALGSPVAVTDQAGNVVERSEYEPYGKVINGTPKDGPGYTGHVLDAATGLNYMQQRYYDPGIGRFLSVDPVTANSGTGANFNRYWYANNNPYRFKDPDGRVTVELDMTRAEKAKYRDQIRQFEKSVKKTEAALVKNGAPEATKFVATTFVISTKPLPPSVAAKAGANAGNVKGYEISPGDNKVNLTAGIFDLGDPKAETESYFGRKIGSGSESNLTFGYLHEWRHDFAENAKFFESGDPAGGEAEANQFADRLLPTVMEEQK